MTPKTPIHQLPKGELTNKTESMTDNNKEEQACINPIEEQRKQALKHYEEASAAICHWSSFVENAIKSYSPTPIPDVEESAREYAKNNTNEGFGSFQLVVNAFEAGAAWQKSQQRQYEWQLCPQCNGDGNLLRYNSPNMTSTTPICDVCYGSKIIPKPAI